MVGDSHFMNISMKIDNSGKASQMRMIYAFIPLFTVLLVASVYLFNLASDLTWVFCGLSVLAVYVVLVVLFGNNYVIVFIGPDKVVVRYKALWPIRTENNSIEISADDFAGYEIVKKPFRTNMTIYKNTIGGKAKYPEVCINLLSSEQIDKIKRSFAILETVKRKNP